jgi:hypothetical protein
MVKEFSEVFFSIMLLCPFLRSASLKGRTRTRIRTFSDDAWESSMLQQYKESFQLFHISCPNTALTAPQLSDLVLKH